MDIEEKDELIKAIVLMYYEERIGDDSFPKQVEQVKAILHNEGLYQYNKIIR